MRPAGEAVIEALLVDDVERRLAVAVERAQRHELPAFADKLVVPPDHARHRHAVAKLVEEALGQGHVGGGSGSAERAGSVLRSRRRGESAGPHPRAALTPWPQRTPVAATQRPAEARKAGGAGKRGFL